MTSAEGVDVDADANNPSSGTALEPFLLLAKNAKGVAAQHLIMQVLPANNTFVFGELLECQNIKDLKDSDTGKSYHDLLEIFAFGTFKDYLAAKERLPELTEPMISKLRRLTIVTLASIQKRIPYASLQADLDLGNVRELEDLVIESIYCGMLRGNLDQRKQELVVDYCMGRDVREKDVAEMTKILQDWASSSKCLILSMEEQMQKADKKKAEAVQHQKQVEDKFEKMKKSSKGSSSAEVEVIPPDVGSSDDRKKEKRSKLSGLRGSAPKVWKNN